MKTFCGRKKSEYLPLSPPKIHVYNSTSAVLSESTHVSCIWQNTTKTLTTEQYHVCHMKHRRQKTEDIRRTKYKKKIILSSKRTRFCVTDPSLSHLTKHQPRAYTLAAYPQQIMIIIWDVLMPIYNISWTKYNAPGGGGCGESQCVYMAVFRKFIYIKKKKNFLKLKIYFYTCGVSWFGFDAVSTSLEKR